MSNEVNLHNDHVASCLCCKHLSMVWGEPAHMDDPEESSYIYCGKAVFHFDRDSDIDIFQVLHDSGRQCKFFLCK